MELALPSSKPSSKRGDREQKPNVTLIDPAKQVEEYIKVSKETSSVAYELACIAQDLGSLWSHKYNDDKSVTADQLIEQIVGDRIPFTFGKRASDTIPAGLQALGQFLSEDPRHYGVRLSALYTGGNYIQERGERNKAPAEANLEIDSSEDSSDSGSDRTSEEESVNSVDSEEIANFDAQKWHREVDALLAEIQSKKEWETMAALREMYIFKDSERAADIVHVEALAELNDGELRGFDKTREELDTQVEAKQLEMLQTLSSFNNTLKSTTTEIIRRRHARKKAAGRKRFSFANIDEVVLVEKQDDKSEDGEDANVARAAEVARQKKANKAGEILEHISGLQKSMNGLVHDTHQKKLALEVHNEALIHLTLSMEAAESGGEPPEAKEEIKEILRAFQEEAKDLLEAKKKAEADALLQEATSGVPDVSEESLKQQTPEELKVMLTRAEGEVQLLQKKVQELERARITQARGGADRIQKAKKAVQLAQQNSEKPAKGDGSPSARSIRNAVDDKPIAKKPEPNAIPPHQLLGKLEQQLPAAQKALEDLKIHRDKFMESCEKAQQLREQFFLDPQSLQRRLSEVAIRPKARPEPVKPKEVKPVQLSPEEIERREEFQRLEEEVKTFQEKLLALSQHFSKVLGTEVGADTLDTDIISALLEDKESEQRQKQDQLAQLREELAELQKAKSNEVPPSLPAVPAVVPAVVPAPVEPGSGVSASQSGEGPSPTSPRRLSQLDAQAMQDLLGKQVNPELMQQLLAAQGETLNIQAQLNSIEELTKTVRSKGTNLSPQEKQQLKDLFGKPDIKTDESSEASALREEKKKIKELEKQVGQRRDEWSNIEGASKVLRGLAEGNMTHGELMKKVRMVKAAFVRTGDVEAGSGSTELGTLQTAAAMARSAKRRRNSDVVMAPPEAATLAAPFRRRFSEVLASPRSGAELSSRSGSAAARSASVASVEVEVDELLDEPPAPALEAPAGWSQLTPAASSGQRQASPERHPPGGTTRNQRRRSSGGKLMGGIIDGVGQVSLQVAVNMRRRHSLAAGVRGAQGQMGMGPPLSIAGTGHGSEAQQSDRMFPLNLSPRRASV